MRAVIRLLGPMLMFAGVCLVAPAAPVVAAAAAAVPDLPRGDLTGDGTVDAYALVWSEVTFSCSLVITPADTAGPFAGRTFTLPIQPGGDFTICPVLTALGQVRSDGSWQLFVADYDDGDGHSLVAAVRGRDDFGVESPAFNTEYPGAVIVRDTDGDGRDDQVFLPAGENSQSYGAAVDGNGHFGAVIPLPNATSSVSLSLTAVDATFGDPDILEITVIPDPSDPAGFNPTGQVLISDNDGPPQALALTADPFSENSRAELDVSAEAPGRHVFTVTYPGDDWYFPSSATITLGVRPAATRTTVQLPSPALAGLPLSVVVQVRSASSDPDALAPNGPVVVTVDGRVAGSGQVTDGRATVDLGALGAGTHRVTASFAGGGGWVPSSATTSLVVRKVPTRTTVRASPTAPAVGARVTLTISVVPTVAAGGTPTGVVGLAIDGRPATVRLSGGRATLTTTFASPGRHTVLVGYAGDATRAASGSAVTVTAHR